MVDVHLHVWRRGFGLQRHKKDSMTVFLYVFTVVMSLDILGGYISSDGGSEGGI